MGISLVPEPELIFAERKTCEDPRTGLLAFGPYSKTDTTRRDTDRIGVVGPAEAVDRAIHLVESLRRSIEHDAKLDVMLHPSFPGMNDGDPFQVQLVSQSAWQRTLRVADIAQIVNHPSFTSRVALLRDAVTKEVTALSKLDPRPDVILVAMTQQLEELCRVGIAEHDSEKKRPAEVDDDNPEDIVEDAPLDEADDDDEFDEARSFRRALKADSLNTFPTQLLWHRTLVGGRGVQDPATRAWNLSVALMYKAGIIPWRLADAMAGSCFVGISFFHPDGDNRSTLRTSVAQAFTDGGEGFVLQGEKFEWDSKKHGDKAPHLDKESAKKLLQRVLDTYADQIQSSPRKVVIHKSSRFTADEREGFEEALKGVSHFALVTIGRRGICCLRPGNKPTLRGTLVDFGQKRGLIYTIGYIPFLRCYPGFRIPQPLEVMENWGSLSLREVAEDIMRLTKLNWNTSAYSCVDPITLAFSRRAGEILKVANTTEPALQYRYYM
jgi:hypothetical protein